MNQLSQKERWTLDVEKLRISGVQRCQNCGMMLSNHSSWPEWACPTNPSDQRIKLLCDALQCAVKRLRDEPSVERMKDVVNVSRQIEDLAFTCAILKKQEAVQVTNKKVSWLTPATVQQFKQEAANDEIRQTATGENR